jgi:hypothetical protein
VPSLEAPHIETRLGLAVVVVGQCCLHTAAREVLSSCWQDGAEGLEAVRMVRWFLWHRLGGGVALLAASDI